MEPIINEICDNLYDGSFYLIIIEYVFYGDYVCNITIDLDQAKRQFYNIFCSLRYNWNDEFKEIKLLKKRFDQPGFPLKLSKKSHIADDAEVLESILLRKSCGNGRNIQYIQFNDRELFEKHPHLINYWLQFLSWESHKKATAANTSNTTTITITDPVKK